MFFSGCRPILPLQVQKFFQRLYFLFQSVNQDRLAHRQNIIIDIICSLYIMQSSKKRILYSNIYIYKISKMSIEPKLGNM